MALDTDDPKSGFRHSEVVLFINEEVTRNGGGPGFYLTFRSRPWKDIEDGLKSVVIDTHVPRSIKRACAWSALALGVRVAVRQQEKQLRRVQQLHDQVEEHEAATWTLATDLQRLREERDEVVSELLSAKNNLKQVVLERDMLQRKLVEFELSQQLLAESQDADYPGTPPRPLIVNKSREALDKGLQNGQNAVSPKAQMASLTVLDAFHGAEEFPASSA
uniref:TEX13 family member C3 n=3 Tax=Rattus norvegicus TaxID=10116 RepID=A0A8I6G6Y1_RAT